MDSRRLLWLATGPDGAVEGVAGPRLFDSPGREHLSELELYVHPDRRRRGVGSQLLAQAVFAARVEQRRCMVGVTADRGPGAAFCEAHGFRRVLTFIHLLLDVAAADTRAADAAPPGYALVAWTRTVPDDLAGAFAAAKCAMNDMRWFHRDRDGQRPGQRPHALRQPAPRLPRASPQPRVPTGRTGRDEMTGENRTAPHLPN
ncbi:GNAT family N-acetyltransferase [Nonomuraea sp. NPDC050451]|uniref:GNAT family N-acetyltransferase n=1 Tax=Nonomuraea sp. NPDC050451 TaxID=3364364 RepID=UPI0037B4D1D2